MTPRLRKLLTQAGSFLLAGVLLYLALRNVDFAEVGEALRTADYRWLLPVAVVTLLSHAFRAWRWQILLEALPPEPGAAPPKVSMLTAFYSIMIGYMVNYVAPRLGEVARSANLARQEKISFPRVLGTVFVERLLDVVILLLALMSVGLLMMDRWSVVKPLFWDPIVARMSALSLPVVVALVGVVALAGVAFFAWRRRREGGRLRALADSFKEGMATLLHTPQRGALVVSTVLIWCCYTLMAYLPFVIFGMHDTYSISLGDAWSIMILGAVGVAIPSPGGIGSYHYITIQTLVYLFNVPEAPAASYAILTHAGQLVLYTLTGALSLLLQGSSFRVLQQSREASEA